MCIQKLKNRKNKLNVFQFIKIPFKYAPALSLAIVILNLFTGLVPIIQIKIVSNFVDIAIESANTGVTSKWLYVYLLLLMVFLGFDWISNTIVKLLITKLKLRLKSSFRIELITRCSKIKYSSLEDSKTWDMISRVCTKPEEVLVKNFLAIIQLISLFVSITGIVLIITVYVWWASIIILCFCVPLFYLSYRSGKASYDADKAVTKSERMYWYMNWLLTGRECADERSLFHYSDEVDKRFNEAYDYAFKIKTKSRFKWLIKTKLGGICASISALIIIIVLIAPTLNGIITTGTYISLVTSIFSLVGSLTWGLSYRIDTLVNGSEYIKDYNNFMKLEFNDNAVCVPSYEINVQKIEFKNVSFTYPNTEKKILDNISFTLDGKKKYAFVGVNGAGKSTIVKLLTGLYDEYDGEILINGKEIRTMDKAELIGCFCVVYQDFIRFDLSVYDNCAIGNIKDYDLKSQRQEVSDAIEKVGLKDKISSLDDGLDTMLGKIYEGGLDLSGGEWQKLAIARSLVSKASVRVLDEPTAALDPISESEIYKMFNEVSENKFTICISHRLGSTTFSDEILVLDSGKIAEHGSFNELIARKGLYYEMYEQQKSWYDEKQTV